MSKDDLRKLAATASHNMDRRIRETRSDLSRLRNARDRGLFVDAAAKARGLDRIMQLEQQLEQLVEDRQCLGRKETAEKNEEARRKEIEQEALQSLRLSSEQGRKVTAFA